MLKERVTELLNRYEYGDEIMTADDICKELETILDEEPYEEPLSYTLYVAIDKYEIAKLYAMRYGGMFNDCEDCFIEDLESIIGFER